MPPLMVYTLSHDDSIPSPTVLFVAIGAFAPFASPCRLDHAERRAWNPQPVAVWNCSPCERMESSRSDAWNQDRRGKRKYSPAADAMRGRAAMPYNSPCELIPYQALRSWINKKTNRSSSFCFGGQSLIENEPCVFEAVILHSNMGSKHLMPKNRFFCKSRMQN